MANYIVRKNEKKYPGFYFKIRLIQPAFDQYLKQYKDLVVPGDDSHKETSSMPPVKKLLHPEIQNKCLKLFTEGHRAKAVEKSFKVVKDRLRELTGFESGSDAFGKGKLHIRGAAAENVDGDFNKGTQFLAMAIDMYRNEKSHTSDAKIDDPVRAYQYLVLSSLAMYLLDDAEVIK